MFHTDSHVTRVTQDPLVFFMLVKVYLFSLARLVKHNIHRHLLNHTKLKMNVVLWTYSVSVTTEQGSVCLYELAVFTKDRFCPPTVTWTGVGGESKQHVVRRSPGIAYYFRKTHSNYTSCCWISCGDHTRWISSKGWLPVVSRWCYDYDWTLDVFRLGLLWNMWSLGQTGQCVFELQQLNVSWWNFQISPHATAAPFDENSWIAQLFIAKDFRLHWPNLILIWWIL